MAITATQPGYIYELERLEASTPASSADDAICESIAKVPTATSLRGARRLVREAVQAYLPVKVLISTEVVENASRQNPTGTNASRKLNTVLWDSLSRVSPALAQRDRNTILEALKLQSTIAEMDGRVTDGNREYYFHALLEAFWPLQHLDVALTTLVLLARGKFDAGDSRVPHWLCVIVRDQIHAIDGALFRNSPVVYRRLSEEPGAYLTTNELMESLGISG